MQKNLNGDMVLNGTSQNTIIIPCKINHVLNDNNPIFTWLLHGTSHGTLKNSMKNSNSTDSENKQTKKNNIISWYCKYNFKSTQNQSVGLGKARENLNISVLPQSGPARASHLL